MNAHRDTAGTMADAASELLASFDTRQRSAAVFAFPAADERHLWFYTPTDHGGLALADMSSHQHRLVHRLLATGMSGPGYVTVASILNLEDILDHLEGWTTDFGRERGRDPSLFWISIFGSPAAGTWAWRFGGHHVSLNFTIVDGSVASTTPCFLGADPATSPLLGAHLHRPLGAVEDLARELVHSFDEGQRSTAIVAAIAPTDLVGANRPTLREGDTALPLPLIWRGRLEAELDELMGQAHRAAEEQIGVTPEVLGAVSFSDRPKGLSAAAFTDAQRQNLRALLDTYVGRIVDSLADEQAAKFAGTGIETLSFMWAGGIESGEPHYYRIQGGSLFCEYDNTQRDVNHVHSVWRDLTNDFGRDALAEHYAHDH